MVRDQLRDAAIKAVDVLEHVRDHLAHYIAENAEVAIAQLIDEARRTTTVVYDALEADARTDDDHSTVPDEIGQMLRDYWQDPGEWWVTAHQYLGGRTPSEAWRDGDRQMVRGAGEGDVWPGGT